MPGVVVPIRPAQTIYKKSVKAVPEKPASSGLFVLKSGGGNAKLGKRLTKGRWRGMPLYTLTLEERKTCWSGCQNWGRCYGDNMPFAHRYQHGPELEYAIEEDVATLQKKHSEGFVVRLHVLGDFYSPEYVLFWGNMLQLHSGLRIYGYTHWQPGSTVGDAVTALVQAFPATVSILRSDAVVADDPLPKAMTIDVGAGPAPQTVLCPEQTGRTASCSTCGLCMNGRTAVSFIDHSRQLKVVAA